jgi:hypothetical protein
MNLLETGGHQMMVVTGHRMMVSHPKAVLTATMNHPMTMGVVIQNLLNNSRESLMRDLISAISSGQQGSSD